MYRAAWLRVIKYECELFTEVVVSTLSVSVSVSRRGTDERVLSFRRAARGDPASGVFNQHTV